MKQWRDDIKRFFATYFMINYETGMLEWIDGGEVKTRDDAYGNPMIRYGTRDYY
ncbi:HNH endonuclease, partial [Shigella sonnei]|nr:HNH endonuclease [Shigella sonnei]EFZ7524501.1 HNH endonuclease [Shigella sonnei]